jgi:DNA-binding CsgD family transcriptional regulator
MDASSGEIALSLYEALLDGGGLLGAVQSFADRIGADSHAIHQMTYRNGRPSGTTCASRNGVAPEALDDYARFWVKHDPWAKAGATLPAGVHDLAEHVPPEDLARSRIWNEWGRPNDAAFHGMVVVVQREEAAIGGLVFHRRARREGFSAADQDQARALFPHLKRVFAAEAILSQAREPAGPAMRAGLDALTEGVALLDTRRKLAFANIALRRMVAQHDGLALAGDGGLDTPSAKCRQALARAVTAALAALDGQVGLLPFAGSLAVPRPSGGAPWLVRAVPVLRSDVNEVGGGFRGVMLLVTDGERRGAPNAALLARLYGLTPAQAALGAALAAGKTLQDHAAARGISQETARSHLAAVRRKTGCRRQADLAALFARLPAS